MKPAYELFKRVVAEPLGQAAIPSNIEEAQRGMVSTIDTIVLDDGEAIDIRGWIRTFADSGKPIYVGIYTSFRHEDRGYVSVGFPIPSSNFTATLQPHNIDGDGLAAHARSSDLEFPGHYLSAVDRTATLDRPEAAGLPRAHPRRTSTTASSRPSTPSRSPGSASSRCTTRSLGSKRPSPPRRCRSWPRRRG